MTIDKYECKKTLKRKYLKTIQLEMENFDFIIIGAGSAGCVLANRLSANPNNKILLLEAGGKDSNPWIHIPGGYFKTMHNPKTDWCFNTEKEPNCNNREMVYPRGKTLGGSSSINGMLYIRGQSNDYNYWRQLGNVGWSWEDVLPYFKTMHNPETDWCFNTEKEPNCNNREMVYPRGKTLGGSSSINGMLYIRGQSNDYNYWRQLGNVGWSWDHMIVH